MGKLCGRLLNITFDMEINGCMEDVKVSIVISYTYNSHIHTHAFEMFTSILSTY